MFIFKLLVIFFMISNFYPQKDAQVQQLFGDLCRKQTTLFLMCPNSPSKKFNILYLVKLFTLNPFSQGCHDLQLTSQSVPITTRSCHDRMIVIIPPQRSCRGVYWFHHVCPSVCRQILCRTIT